MKPSFYRTITKHQKVNQFPRSIELTRKDLMADRINQMSEEFGKHNFGFMPKTFVLPKEYWQCKECMDKEKRFWIVKPAGSSQGKGIFITCDSADLDDV